MDTIGKRIRALRQKLDLTQEEFAAFLGGSVTRGAVGNWERDQGIKRANISLVAEKTNTSFDWIANGISIHAGLAAYPEGSAADQLREHRRVEESYIPFEPEPDDLPGGAGDLAPGLFVMDGTEWASIPRYDASLSAGHGSVIDPHADPLGFYVVEAQWLATITRAMPQHLALLRVDGDSMRPTFDHGDWLLVDRSQTRINVPGVYALAVGDAAWVKRLSLNLSERVVRIISDNPAYPEEQLPEEDIHLIGRVLRIAWGGV